jgi:hypothetical protein
MQCPSILVDGSGSRLRKARPVSTATNLCKDLRMNACDAAGLGRKIEVEGKKYDPPAQCLTAITSFRLRM